MPSRGAALPSRGYFRGQPTSARGGRQPPRSNVYSMSQTFDDSGFPVDQSTEYGATDNNYHIDYSQEVTHAQGNDNWV